MHILIHLVIVYLFTPYLIIYLFSFDTNFRLVNSSFCHFLSMWGGGPHTNHHTMYILFSSFVFRGNVYMYVYLYIAFFELFKIMPLPPHSVNMGLSLEVHGALVLFW